MRHRGHQVDKHITMNPLCDVRNRLLNGWQLSKRYTFGVAARHQSFALAADELSLSPSAARHYDLSGSLVNLPHCTLLHDRQAWGNVQVPMNGIAGHNILQ